jgi:peptidyl-prolyl cis-trans isomerase SurA
MKRFDVLLFRVRRALCIAALMAAMAAAMTGRVEAQAIVVVNGEPITQYDIEQRGKLIQVSTQKTAARNDIVEELIAEKLKIGLLKKFNIPDVDKDVDSAFANMARRMRVSPRELTANLSKQGVNTDTLKQRIKADIIWQQMIRGRYQSSFQFSDKEINERLKAKNREDATAVGYDYTLRPILFVVPPGSPPAAFEARAKEAEALRARFQNCENGLPMARGLRYVAVRPPVMKSTADLAAPLRAVLEKTDVGHLTPPETTQQGVEIYAVCGRRQSENAPAKKEVRDEMYGEMFQSLSKKMLKELRDQAMIEYRQ